MELFIPPIADQIQNEVIRTLGFYQPFGTLMLHGKIETRWVRIGRRTPFPFGLYLIYNTKKPCSEDQLLDWCGSEIATNIKLKTKNDSTINKNGCAIAIGRLIGTRDMVLQDEAEAYVRYKGIVMRKDKEGRTWKYNQRLLYFTDVKPIIPFQFTGKQGVGILPDNAKHLIQLA